MQKESKVRKSPYLPKKVVHKQWWTRELYTRQKPGCKKMSSKLTKRNDLNFV